MQNSSRISDGVFAPVKERRAKSDIYKRGSEANWNPIAKSKAKQLAQVNHAMKKQKNKRMAKIGTIEELDDSENDSYYGESKRNEYSPNSAASQRHYGKQTRPSVQSN